MARAMRSTSVSWRLDRCDMVVPTGSAAALVQSWRAPGSRWSGDCNADLEKTAVLPWNRLDAKSNRMDLTTPLMTVLRARPETNASTWPSKFVTLAKARVQKSRGGIATFAILDARLREHDEVSVDSLMPLRTLSPDTMPRRRSGARINRGWSRPADLPRSSLRMTSVATQVTLVQ